MISRRLVFALVCFCVSLSAGCHPAAVLPEQPAVDLDGVIENAAAAKQPVVILIGEFGPGGADRATGELLDSPAIQFSNDGAELLKIDLTSSRNRATAARYHIAQTPVLVCLSPRGVIVSRDQGRITPELLMKRMDGLGRRASALDAKYMLLKNAATSNSADVTARNVLAQFLLAQQNAREAIPYLQESADSTTIPTADRINAWVAMARAHLWIGEPEKARHESQALIATLGRKFPEAVAGGKLVLGLQDIAAKRYALARQEFQGAVTAAPESIYATSAGDELAELHRDGK